VDKLQRFVKDESGVTAIEYALIAAATGLLLITAMPLMKAPLSAAFESVATGVEGAAGEGAADP
jgi:pilus assembly protein Flp/PilA